MKALTQNQYVALGRTLLHGEPLSEDLLLWLAEFTSKLQISSMQAGKDTEGITTFLWLLFPLALLYGIQASVREGRCPAESPAVQAANEMCKALIQILTPRMTLSLLQGDATSFSRLAGVIEAAKGLSSNSTALGDLTKIEGWLGRLFRSLTGRGMKFQKKTQRLRALFPLWLWGFGDLSYVQQCAVFQQIGLSDDEIPEEDTLRQLLSYYRIPKLLASLRTP